MNFLAHIYLSGSSTQILLGNFIADSVKGNKYKNYPEGIAHGILLHRKIDEFTDSHEMVRTGKRRLAAHYGKYAGVIVDVFYDHFLALHWARYSKQNLEDFSQIIYKIFLAHIELLPEQTKKFLPYMISQNWLLNYANITGIEQTLKGLSRRAKYDSNMEKAVAELQEDFILYEREFLEFFPQVIGFVSHYR